MAKTPEAPLSDAPSEGTSLNGAPAGKGRATPSRAEQEAAQQMWKYARAFGKADALASLRAFEAGKLPSYSQDDWQRAERAAKGNMPAAWLAYRDAWIALGKLRYPAVAPHAWKAYFTLKRTAAPRN